MVNDHRKTRRDMLKILGSVPISFVLGCSDEQPETPAGPSATAGNSALGDVVASIGHWTENREVLAVAFADRLLLSPSGKQYLGEVASLITRIANKLPQAAKNPDSIDLAVFTSTERDLLLRFVGRFYSYLEVRNQVYEEPVFGECQADPLFYTGLKRNSRKPCPS